MCTSKGTTGAVHSSSRELWELHPDPLRGLHDALLRDLGSCMQLLKGAAGAMHSPTKRTAWLGAASLRRCVHPL